MCLENFVECLKSARECARWEVLVFNSSTLYEHPAVHENILLGRVALRRQVSIATHQDVIVFRVEACIRHWPIATCFTKAAAKISSRPKSQRPAFRKTRATRGFRQVSRKGIGYTRVNCRSANEKRVNPETSLWFWASSLRISTSLYVEILRLIRYIKEEKIALTFVNLLVISHVIF